MFPPSHLAVPTACFVAIGMVANFTIFPETLNSSYTTDLVDRFLIPILQRSHLHSKLLSTTPPTKEGGAKDWEALGSQFDETQRAISAGLEGLLGSAAMLELEVSFGRLGAKDLKGLAGRLRELLSKSMGLGVLYRTVARQHRVGLSSERRGRKSRADLPLCEHSADSVPKLPHPLPLSFLPLLPLPTPPLPA